MFRDIFIRIGLARGVLIATAVAILSSVSITYAVMRIKGAPFSDIALTVSLLAPLLTAPFLFWPLFSAFIKIHHLELEMRRLAMVDDLTGIMNRRAFLSRAEHLLNVANRSDKAVALVYIDLDNFKAINDDFGHAAGDAVLKRFADILGGVVRQSDLVGRLGGEEFALVIYGAGKDDARRVVEILLSETRDTRVAIAGHLIHFTTSAGLAYLPAGERLDVEQLLAQADKALHRAKHTGKDRVVVYEGS
jgi:diguanylate cyclase (GGDEF)-like protein